MPTSCLLRRVTAAVDVLWWTVLSGLPLACAYLLCALAMLSTAQRARAAQCVSLARYFVWPFDSVLCVRAARSRRESTKRAQQRAKRKESPRNFVELCVVPTPRGLVAGSSNSSRRSSLGSLITVPLSSEAGSDCDSVDQSSPSLLNVPPPPVVMKVYSPRSAVVDVRRSTWHGARHYHVLLYALLLPMHGALFVLNWLPVLSIPSAKIVRDSWLLLLRHGSFVCVRRIGAPMERDVHMSLYVPHAAALRYAHYCSFSGFNAAMVNMSLLAFFIAPMALGMWSHVSEQYPVPVFSCALVCMIPLAYFVGLAVERVAEQSTAGVASFLNSTVGSLVDTILTGSALLSGGLVPLVKATMIGSLLCCLLLFPGLAMISSGVKHRNSSTPQLINAVSASIAAELLLLSAFGAFTPTLFYYSYGSYAESCDHCALNTATNSFNCRHCRFQELYESDHDDVYTSRIRPLTYVCSALLPVVYVVSLLYTLRTHADELYGSPRTRAEIEGSVGPPWSKRKCYVVLVVSVVVFGLVAVSLVNVMQRSAELLGMSQQFLGVTILSLAPSVTELISTIRFALDGKISLAIEVSATYAVQIMLVQFPLLVAIAAIGRAMGNAEAKFTLLFEPVDVFCVIMSIFIVNFVLSHSSKTNYVEGALLCAVWCIVIAAYWFSS